MSYTEQIFCLKTEQIHQQITNIRNLVNQFNDYQQLRSFIQLISDELENSTKIIEQKKSEMTDFDILISKKDHIPRRIKEIFSKIMDTLGNQETRLMKMEQILSQMSIWESQRKGTSILSNKHKALEKFGNEMCNVMKITTPVISNFGTEFRSIPCESFTFHLAGYITNLPETIANQIDGWPILAHELGHVYHHENYAQIKENINNPLELQIRKLGIPKEDADEMIDIWNGHWIPELVSDVIATLILGPAYVEKVVVDAFGMAPTEFSPPPDSHPPWKIRVDLILEVIRKLNLTDYEIHEKMFLWKEYKEIFAEKIDPKVLNLFINGQTVQKASDLITSSIQIAPIKNIWENVLAIKNGSSIENHSMLDLISMYFLENDLEKRSVLERAISAKC